MRLLVSLTAAGLLISAASLADDQKPSTGLESSPANQTALQESQRIYTETQSGNEVQIAPDGTVAIYKGEGKVTPPDGPIALKDGSTITVKDGKKM